MVALLSLHVVKGKGGGGDMEGGAKAQWRDEGKDGGRRGDTGLGKLLGLVFT